MKIRPDFRCEIDYPDLGVETGIAERMSWTLKTARRAPRLRPDDARIFLREVMMKENSGVRFPNQSGRMGPQKCCGHQGRAVVRPIMPGESDREIAAGLAGQIAEIPDVRTELVTKVGSQIEAGTYVTPKKLDIAVTKMISEYVEESNI